MNATGSVRRRHGLGLMEMMVSLSIVAALLTATAVALDASVKAYAINQEQAGLMQQARIAVDRIAAYVRASREHSPVDANQAAAFASGLTVADNGITLFDQAGSEVSFTYDAPNKRVMATLNGTPHVLARGVEAFVVRMEPMRSATSIKTGGSWDLLRRATILITVRTNSETSGVGETRSQQTVTLCAAVVPRQNAW